jgi:hypothetical protein
MHNRDLMMAHLKHMASTRPAATHGNRIGDREAAAWALEEIDRLLLAQDCVLKTLQAERNAK